MMTSTSLRLTHFPPRLPSAHSGFLLTEWNFGQGKWQGRQGDWPEDTKEAGVWDKILCQNGQMT